jgi:putative transposase
LARNAYRGRQFYFVTICCYKRRKIFADAGRCQWLLDLFCAECAAREFAVQAYCVMPDHFHFLAESIALSSDPLALIKNLKIKSSRAYHRETRTLLWQKKFYDHILRPREMPEAVAWYIWMNPVRQGLTSAPREYQFAGSLSGLVGPLKPSAGIGTPPWKSPKAPASEGGHYKFNTTNTTRAWSA